MATRWGIVSAGSISHDFTLALSTLPADEHTVIAVAARELQRAVEFCSTHNIPKAYGSYEEMAEDPDIDAIYIGSINTEHLRLGKLFLEAGKPVLCEKPLCMNKKEAQELVSIAKSKNLFLMEAIWSRFNPVYRKIREEIDAGTIGDVIHVQINFGVKIEHKDRVAKKELGGSALLDIGVYCIQFATFVLGKPTSIQASGHLNADGVDDTVNAIFNYPEGKTAVLSATARALFKNEARIVGTKGTIVVDAPFWCPTSMTVLDQPFAIQLPVAHLEFRYKNSAALRFEAIEVRRCLQKGLVESPLLTWEESLNIAEIEDDIRRQIGEVFNQD